MSAALPHPVCRLLPYIQGDGPHNMAADEVLLESAVAGTASLRFYGWTTATVSLGYFQPRDLRHGAASLAGLPCVRRPSGGAALVHHHELTYALALPAGPPWQGLGSGPAAWLCRMHGIISDALTTFGISAQAAVCNDESAYAGMLCFQKLTPGDLLIGTAKVVGSAQRRQKGALLQHGGLLLAASPYTPLLPGVQELTGRKLQIGEVCGAIERELSRQTGWDLLPGEYSTAERQRIEELIRTKYGQECWNRKR